MHTSASTGIRGTRPWRHRGHSQVRGDSWAGMASTASPTLTLYQSWKRQSTLPGYRLERYNTLSTAIGVKHVCELSGEPAAVSLVTPITTLYFASEHDAVLAWEGIFHKILPLIGSPRLTSTPPHSRPPSGPLQQRNRVLGSREERERHRREMMDALLSVVRLTKQVAQDHITRKEWDLALPGTPSLSHTHTHTSLPHAQVPSSPSSFPGRSTMPTPPS